MGSCVAGLLKLPTVEFRKWDLDGPPKAKGKITLISAGGVMTNVALRGTVFIVATALALIALAFLGLGLGSAVMAFSGSLAVGEAIAGLIFFSIPCVVLGTSMFGAASMRVFNFAFTDKLGVPSWKTVDNKEAT